MSERTCVVDGCCKAHYGLGYCRTHYRRVKAHGSTDLLPPRGCDVQGCSNRHSCRGLCDTHYQRFRKSGSTDLRVAVVKTCVCVDCGVSFDRDPDKLGGTPPKRCPDHRREARRRTLAKYDRARDPEDRRAYGRQYYAANRAELSAYAAAWAAARLRASPDFVLTFTCRYCGGEFDRDSIRGTVPSMCMDCRPIAMAEGRARWIEANPEKYAEARAAYGYRRRAIEQGVEAEDIDRRVVFARDGWVCGICGESIDPALKHPDKRSVSLDHILPLARGGTHTYDNVQAACLGCNVRKNMKYPEPRPQQAG